MIGRLYGYFGLVGSASILAWGGALVVLVVFLRSQRRGWFYWIALALAGVGLALAEMNSQRVSAVPLAPAGAPVGIQSVDEPPMEAGVPAYRQMGKQRRDTGPSAVIEPVEQPAARTFRESELLEANRFDRWNLLATRGTLLLVLLALVTDYLARFNRTTGGSYPLPIAGPWLDRLFPKSHAVLAHALNLTTYLETVVRRGETFLYFTSADPWAAPALPRLGKYCRLVKIRYGECAPPEFYFDAVWFNRYCVVVPAVAAAAALRQLEQYLEWRNFTKAAARRTIHLAWDLPEPPPAALLASLNPLCREANFKLIVKAPVADQQQFDEIHDGSTDQLHPHAKITSGHSL